MRLFSGLLLLVCAAVCFGQSGDESQLAAAKAELVRLRKLVDAGALPRLRLTAAQEAVADAEDAAFLRKTAYGQDLTVDQADEMLAAANRRLERRQKALDNGQALVTKGAAAQTSLKPLMDDLEQERQECKLADSRASLVRELSDMAMAEEAYLGSGSPDSAGRSTESESEGQAAYATYAKVEVAFREHFGKPMPISAIGETAVHRSMGFDHRGRVDVAVSPDQPEGVWLLQYLTENHIPYFAFRQAVKGKATGAHIHIGPVSTRMAAGGL